MDSKAQNVTLDVMTVVNDVAPLDVAPGISTGGKGNPTVHIGTPSRPPHTTTTTTPCPTSFGSAESTAIVVNYLHIYDKYFINGTYVKPGTASSRTLSLFYGFSGPTDREGSFEYWAQCVGESIGWSVTVVMADTFNGVDLADDTSWNQTAKDLGPGGRHDGSLWSPPCSTYSRARKEDDGGPRPLRGSHPPELLGLPGLLPAEKEKVRLGTLLACRTAQGIGAQGRAGAPWLFENPPEEDDYPSIFRIPEVAEELNKQGAFSQRFPQ